MGRQNYKKAKKILDGLYPSEQTSLLDKILEQRPSAIINAYKDWPETTTEKEEAEKEKLVKLIKEGKKIDAVKLYREQSGTGLREAYDYVTKLSDNLFRKDGE